MPNDIDFTPESPSQTGGIDFQPEEAAAPAAPDQPALPLPPSSWDQVGAQNARLLQDIPQFRGILPPNPDSIGPSKLSPLQRLRYSDFGSSIVPGGIPRALLGPTKEEQEMGQVPFSQPGIIPIAMTAPFPFMPGAESKAGRILLGGFITKFLKDAPDAYRSFDDAIKKKNYPEARRIAVDFGFGAAFNALAGKGLFEHYTSPPEVSHNLPRSETQQAPPQSEQSKKAAPLPVEATAEHGGNQYEKRGTRWYRKGESTPAGVFTDDILDKQVAEQEGPKAKVRVDRNEDGTWQVSAELPNGDTITEDHPTAEVAGDRAAQLEREGFKPGEHSEELTDEEVEAHRANTEDEAEPDLSTPEGMEEFANQVAKRWGHTLSLEAPETKGENQPFATQTGGYFFRAFGNNKIGMRQQQFHDWIQSIPPEQRRAAIEARVNEEVIHNEVIDSLGGPARASKKMGEFWDNLSRPERAINRRRYIGQWGAGEYSPDQLGHEAVRFRLQRARGMTPSEFAETARRERWTLKSLTVLEDMIRGARETLGTGAATRNKALLGELNNALRNIQVAKPIAQQNDQRYPEAASRHINDYLESVRTGKSVSTEDAYEAGLKSRTVEDLEALANARIKGSEEMFKRLRGGDPEGAVKMSSVVQLPREAIEAATDTGSAQESEKQEGQKLGDRPLDWRKNPEVAEWLQENAKKLGITLPDDFKVPEAVRYPEASKRGKFKLEGQTPEELEMEESDKNLESALNLPIGSDPFGGTWRDHFIDKETAILHFVESEGSEELSKATGSTAEIANAIKRWLDAREESGEGRITVINKAIKAASKALKEHGHDTHSYDVLKYRVDELKKMAVVLAKAQNIISFPEAANRGKRREAEIGYREGDLPFGQRTASDVEKERQTKEGEVGARPSPQQMEQKAQEFLKGPIEPVKQVERTRFTDKELREREKKKALEKELYAGETPDEREKRLARQAKVVEAPTYNHPEFSDFRDWVRRNVGTVGDTQIASMWEDAVWKSLINATPERLAEWRRGLDLEGKFGGRDISTQKTVEKPEDFTAEKKQAQASAASMRANADKIENALRLLSRTTNDPEYINKLERGLGAQIDKLRADADAISAEQREKRLERRDLEKTQGSQQSYRSRLIVDIASRLLKPVIPSQSLDRESIGMEDIDFANPNTSEGSYRALSGRERENPELLSNILRDESRSKGKPLSHTKRLLAVVDNDTKKVHLVSTYWDGTSQKVVDPAYAGIKMRPNRNLDASFLRRYRPLDSILLSQPVKDFHQQFETVSEYNDRLRNEADAMSQQGDYPFAGESAEFAGREGGTAEDLTRLTPDDKLEEQNIPGTPGLPSEAGTITGGPGSIEAAAGLGKGVGVIERARGAKMTPREAGALWDAFDHYEIESPEDFENLLQYLGTKSKGKDITGKRTPLKGRELQIITAIDKAVGSTMEMLQKHSPDEATPENAIKVALQEIYGSIAFGKEAGQNRQAHILDTLRTFGGDIEGRPQEAAQAETGKELTNPISRVAPTVVRGIEGKPVYAASESPPVPIGAGTPGTPEKLAGEPVTEGSYQYEPTTKPIFPEIPTTPGKVGGKRFTGEAPSGAFRASPEELPFERSRTAQSLAQTVKQLQKQEFARDERAYSQWLQKYSRSLNDIRYPEGSIRQKQNIEDHWNILKDFFKAGAMRAIPKAQLHTLRDVADNTASRKARNAGEAVRLASRKDLAAPGPGVPSNRSQTKANEKEAQMVRRAAKAVIATGEIAWMNQPNGKLKGFWSADRGKLAKFLVSVDNAAQAARFYMSKSDPVQKMIGRKWLDAATKLREELDYAQKNWNNAQLKSAVAAARKQMRDQWQWERKNGIKSIRRDMNYVPGRYDAEIWNDNSVLFGGMRILGRNFRNPKSFRNYYEAIEAGPYIPANYDVADLVEHRVRQGSQMVNKNSWFDTLHAINDPVTGEPIVMEPVMRKGKPAPPSEEYVVQSFDKGRQTLAVRRGFEWAVKSAAGEESIIRQMPVAREALRFTQWLKHNGILIYDTFHPTRLAQYAVALGGGWWKGGWSALEFAESDLPKAVSSGAISQKDADWASAMTDVNFGKGNKVSMSNRQLLDAAIGEGLNVGRLQDALYGEVRHLLPGLSTMNRFIFDKLTRGLMVETAVRNFKKYNASHPDVPFKTLMRDVVRDINIFYGSLGRQGFIRHPFLRDMSQMFLLAPQWVEGLAQKETRFYSRATGLSKLTGRGNLPWMGTLGSGMAKGLGAYFVLTQVLNLITRHKPTWKNDEEGHKMDAWIPTGDKEGDGFWVSPASVFAELSHDILRMLETKPTAWDAIEQVGSNKLGPWGRMAAVMGSKSTSTGQYIPTTAGRLAEMGKQLTPVPITLGKPAQWVGNKLAPNMVPAPQPGSTMRQVLASMTGIKTQPGESATQQIQRMADRYVRENNLRPETVHMTQTTAPSYGKLRSAIRAGDFATAKGLYRELLKTRSEDKVVRAMEQAARRPFTGGNQSEQLFLNSLGDRELELYSKAQQDRLEELNKFLDWLSQNR